MCYITGLKKVLWKAEKSKINFILGGTQIVMKELDFEEWVVFLDSKCAEKGL